MAQSRPSGPVEDPMGAIGSTLLSAAARVPNRRPPHWGPARPPLHPRPDNHAAIRARRKAIFVSVELSHSPWVIPSLARGGGEKMSKQEGEAPTSDLQSHV